MVTNEVVLLMRSQSYVWDLENNVTIMRRLYILAMFTLVLDH